MKMGLSGIGVDLHDEQIAAYIHSIELFPLQHVEALATLAPTASSTSLIYPTLIDK
jgi:hypothetical protein